MKTTSLLDRVSRRWWFFLILLLPFLLPSYSTLPLNPVDTPKLVIEVLSRGMVYSVPYLFPVFKVVPIVLIVGIVFFGDRLTRAFHAYAALCLVLCAVLQNVANTASFGFAVLVGNVVLYSFLGLIWGWEAVIKRSGFSSHTRSVWRYWVVPLALFAFWFPVNTSAGVPVADFSPGGLIANEAGLTACMMVPVFLAVLTLYHPRVNAPVMRITAFVGLVTGLLNAVQFLVSPAYGWWMGVLHLPLVVISAYAFAMSFWRPTAEDERRGYAAMGGTSGEMPTSS